MKYSQIVVFGKLWSPHLIHLLLPLFSMHRVEAQVQYYKLASSVWFIYLQMLSVWTKTYVDQVINQLGRLKIQSSYTQPKNQLA